MSTGASLTAVTLVVSVTALLASLYWVVPPEVVTLTVVPEVTAPAELSISRTVRLPGVPL